MRSLARLRRDLPRDATGAAYLEIPHADDAQDTGAPAGVAVHWLVRQNGDRPGSLARLLTLVGGTGANLIEVQHVREGVELHVRETGVEMVLETRGRDHAQEVLRAIRDEGYEATVLTA